MPSPLRPVRNVTTDRRAHPRIPASAVPYLRAFVTGGPDVTLLDVSKRGVQIATTMHMRAGSHVGIRFLSGDAELSLTSAVVRSSVAVLETSGEVTYHTALAFTDELTLCSAELDSAATGQDDGTVAPVGPADYSMLVVDSRIGLPPPPAASETR